ncbi:MAG: hypothetical protein ACOH2E_05320 [Candidatus Paracaedibacter sp.]
MLLKFKILVSVILLSVPILSMESSSDGKSFETQEDLNRFIGKRSVELYSQLNACSRYPNLQKKESCSIPGEYWDVGAADGKVVIVKNRLVKASVALDQIFHNTENLLDCVTARSIVVGQCLQEILGNHLFDTLYGACEEKLSINRNNNLLFLNIFCSLFCIKKNLTFKDFSQTGGLVSIIILPNYLKVNPDGFYSNDNLITFVNNGGALEYIGFGEDYKNGPISYSSVKNYMVNAYNIGINKSYIAYKMLDIDTIMNELGFKKEGSIGRPPYPELKNCILEANGGREVFFIQDNFLKEEAFDIVQNTPVSTLSLDFIKVAQTEKNLEGFLHKTNQG